MQEMKRGASKLNATAVARIRVGKSSGNRIGAQAQARVRPVSDEYSAP